MNCQNNVDKMCTWHISPYSHSYDDLSPVPSQHCVSEGPHQRAKQSSVFTWSCFNPGVTGIWDSVLQ